MNPFHKDEPKVKVREAAPDVSATFVLLGLVVLLIGAVIGL